MKFELDQYIQYVCIANLPYLSTVMMLATTIVDKEEWTAIHSLIRGQLSRLPREIDKNDVIVVATFANRHRHVEWKTAFAS